jgi:hypothetical protein
MASVSLLHITDQPDAGGLGGHYLGVSHTADPVVPATITRGLGQTLTPVGATVADVWEVGSLAAARELRGRLARQGSRRRICSICSPGNSRGAGRGNYDRKERSR